MKKLLLWLLIVSMIAVFSLAGCKAEAVEEVKEEEAVEEEVIEEEEAVEEEVIEEEEAVEEETNGQELIGACALGNLEDVKRLLEQNADVNAKDNDGLTALMYTVLGDHTETAEVLIDNGADVNAKDNDGLTALMIAEGNDQTEIVNLLREVEEGAVEESIEDTQSSGETTTQTTQGPSKTTYLNNIGNIINEYNMVINHWNTYEKDYNNDLGSYIAFDKAILNKIGEINGMLQNITPASGYEGAQTHFIDLANNLYSYIQQEINYLEDKNFNEATNMTNNFNNTFDEFVDYYNSL